MNWKLGDIVTINGQTYIAELSKKPAFCVDKTDGNTISTCSIYDAGLRGREICGYGFFGTLKCHCGRTHLWLKKAELEGVAL